MLSEQCDVRSTSNEPGDFSTIEMSRPCGSFAKFYIFFGRIIFFLSREVSIRAAQI